MQTEAKQTFPRGRIFDARKHSIGICSQIGKFQYATSVWERV